MPPYSKCKPKDKTRKGPAQTPSAETTAQKQPVKVPVTLEGEYAWDL